MYTAKYGASHALVIGIDVYQNAPPLRFAVSDALGIAEELQRLGFAAQNVVVVTNDKATREGIFNAYMRLTQTGCSKDDRVIIFFAGHGHTVSSRKGEVGFLVPHDGCIDSLGSLIRWDELTRNADLITAKHILFLMDACYGGLAITRSGLTGSVRFLCDMMMRHSRQVLTAGKADEPVSDPGGPLPDHSIFTGHLIEAMRGKAKDNYGNLTANGIIAYVYNAVSRDQESQQTPHYGYVQGDGDMIFLPTDFHEEDAAGRPQDDRMVTIPLNMNVQIPQKNDLDELKELLADE